MYVLELGEGAMAEIKVMVDYEAEGLWCGGDTWSRIPLDLREKFRDWNWWWELGQYRLCLDGIHFERNPVFDHDESAFVGLSLAMQLQQAMPDTRVIFFHEGECDRAFADAQESGHGYNFPNSHCTYEICIGPDMIEARHVQK